MRDAAADPAELVILALLGEEAMYGYLLSRRAGVRSQGAVSLSPGVLYPLLARLERQGYIASSWEEVKSERSDEDAPGRRRKWYRLTAKGKRRLDQRVKAHRAFQAVLDRFIAPAEEPSP